jgi:hypothetical protein
VSVNQDKKDPENGKITASLINGSGSLDHAVMASINKYKGKKPPHEDFDNCMRKHQGSHKHQGEIQVFDGRNDTLGLDTLPHNETLEIEIDEKNQNYVKTQPSYDKFMPNLRKIADKAGLKKPADFDSRDPLKSFNHHFISNTVTINRGVIRVRDVGDWDAGSITIPAKYRRRKHFDGPDKDVYSPEAVYQPAKVRFLKAGVFGYVATECVVDVEDANSVSIKSNKKETRRYRGSRAPSLRAAQDTVEILITNYAPQQTIELPWTLHYRWMFEAAGYNVPIPLRGPELDDLKAFGDRYDHESWVCESQMFLTGAGHSGYPFPYRLPEMWKVELGPLDYNQPFIEKSEPTPEIRELAPADPWDPVRCPMGDISPPPPGT